MAEEEEKKKFNFKKIALFGIGPIALVGIGVGVGAFLFMPTQTPVEQVEELIEKSCQLLGIEIEGRDVYSQSKLLLDNMNKHDVDSIKKELENSQATDTLT